MADPPVTEPGGTSRITAEVANPDNVPLTFSWVASGGSISGAEAQALWVAPQSTGEFTISVVVKDTKGRTTSGSIGVYVQGGSSKPAPAPTPTAPKITAMTADPAVTPPGGTSSITAEVTNPDNVPLTISWVASGGSITGTQAQALWVAPQSTGEFTISVTAKDGYGRTANGSIGVNVQASSPAPAPIPSPTGTRDPSMWPFASTSPWNYPIGTGAVYADPTGPLDIMGGNIVAYFNANQWTMSAYKASSNDPLRTVRVTRTTKVQPNPAAPDFCTNTGPSTQQFRIPDNAIPSPPTIESLSSADAHMQIMDPDGTHVWELYQARKAVDGVNWIATDLVKNDLKGPGAGFSCWHGIRSYGGSSMGGLVRAGELSNGIKHALILNISGRNKNKYAPGGKSFVWPASASDNPTNYATYGNLYHGGLLAIPASVNIEAIPFTSTGATLTKVKNIARALQLYGGYIGEGGGGFNTIIFNINYPDGAEASNLPASFNADLKLVCSRLKVVANNGPNSIGGGGTPLTPLPPPLAQFGNSGGYEGDLLPSNPQHAPDSAILLAASVTTLLPLARRRVRTNRKRREADRDG